LHGHLDEHNIISLNTKANLKLLSNPKQSILQNLAPPNIILRTQEIPRHTAYYYSLLLTHPLCELPDVDEHSGEEEVEASDEYL
jgi:hypothetical protein